MSTYGIDPRDEELLTKHILSNYSGFISETEGSALWALQIDWKTLNTESALIKRKLGDLLEKASAPDVLEMRALGSDQLRLTVRNRILAENHAEILLLKCPLCHRLARTPQARMCVHCGHSWYGTNAAELS